MDLVSGGDSNRPATGDELGGEHPPGLHARAARRAATVSDRLSSAAVGHVWRRLNAMDFINRAMLFAAVLFLCFVPFLLIIEALAGQSAATRLIKHFGLTGEAADATSTVFTSPSTYLRRDHRVELRGLRAQRDRRRCRNPGTLRTSLRSRDPRPERHSSPTRVAGHPPRIRRADLLGRTHRARGRWPRAARRPRAGCSHRLLVVHHVAAAGRAGLLAGAVPVGPRDRHLLARDERRVQPDHVQHDHLELQRSTATSVSCSRSCRI